MIHHPALITNVIFIPKSEAFCLFTDVTFAY